jgi:hypothetical protein
MSTNRETQPFELTEADLPEPYQLDLSKLKTEDDYGEAAFELLKEASKTVVWLTGRVPPAPLDRNGAIRRGLLKRLNLLGTSLLSDISGNSGYQQLQIVRQIVEAASNYFYLSEDDASGSRHDAYIKNSLAEEKANLRFITEQINARGGNPLPIEERMRRSMERKASVAGIDLDSVPAKKDIGWPRAEIRLKALSPTAYPSYRGGSSALHSGWSVLLAQDLEEIEGGFSLDKEYGPRVQPMTAAGQLIAETAIHYLEQEGDEAEKAWFLDRLRNLAQRIQEVDEGHEQLMQSSQVEKATDARDAKAMRNDHDQVA